MSYFPLRSLSCSAESENSVINFSKTRPYGLSPHAFLKRWNISTSKYIATVSRVVDFFSTPFKKSFAFTVISPGNLSVFGQTNNPGDSVSNSLIDFYNKVGYFVNVSSSIAGENGGNLPRLKQTPDPAIGKG